MYINIRVIWRKKYTFGEAVSYSEFQVEYNPGGLVFVRHELTSLEHSRLFDSFILNVWVLFVTLSSLLN